MPSPFNISDLAPTVDALFSEWDRPDSPGCTVAVIHDEKVIYQKGFGMANLEYGIPNEPSTTYHVASVSKHFTAFAVQLLASEGRLSLDDNIRKFVPELIDYGFAITVRHLIHHTSGLRDQWNLLGLSGWRSGDLITEEDILKVVWRQKELNFEPGSEKYYSNTGYTLLGLIAKRVSGASLRQFCHERIFVPLGMTDTHFHDDNSEIVKGRAYSYAPSPSGGFQNYPLQFSNVGATSLFTTVSDMARWDRNFDSPIVGDTALINEMHKGGSLNNGQVLDYASGLVNGNYRGLRTVGHDGTDGGFRTAYRRFPDQKFAVVVFSNLSSFDPNLLVHQVAEIFLGELMAPVGQDKSDSSPAKEEFSAEKEVLNQYIGRYYSDELGVIYTISEGDDGLTMEFPKGLATLEQVEVDIINAHPIGQMTFEREQGRITGFRLDNGRVRRLLFEVWQP